MIQVYHHTHSILNYDFNNKQLDKRNKIINDILERWNKGEFKLVATVKTNDLEHAENLTKNSWNWSKSTNVSPKTRRFTPWKNHTDVWAVPNSQISKNTQKPRNYRDTREGDILVHYGKMYFISQTGYYPLN